MLQPVKDGQDWWPACESQVMHDEHTWPHEMDRAQCEHSQANMNIFTYDNLMGVAELDCARLKQDGLSGEIPRYIGKRGGSGKRSVRTAPAG